MQRHRSITLLLALLLLVAAITLNLEEGSAGQTLKPPAKTEVVMTPEGVRSLVERAAASWVKGDAKAFAALFAPDGEFVVPGQRWVGVAAIEKVAAEFAKTKAQVSIKIRRIITDRQQAVVEWQWEEIENGTGKHTQADDVIVIDFADGQVKRWREYIDDKTPQRK